MATGRVPTTANSPLTAKGDLFGYSTTQARVPVGNNGETIVADSSTSTGLRYNPQNALANPVINGAYDIAQRGTSLTTISGYGYTLDRWQSRTASGAGSMVTTRELTNDTTNLPNIQYCARVRRSTGNTDTDALQIQQSFESVNSTPFFGKTVTFSFYARKSANFTGALNAQFISGTGTDQSLVVAFSSLTVVASSTPSLTTTWTRYVATGTVGATVSQLGVLFTSNFVGTAGSDDYFEVTGVQVDLGTYTASTAPTFRRTGGTIQGELAACQRYFSKSYPQGTVADAATQTEGNAQVIAATTSSGFTYVPFPVTMRVSPTVNVYAGAGGSGSGSMRNNSAGPVLTGVVVVNSNTGIYQLSKATSLTVGNIYGYEYTASAEL